MKLYHGSKVKFRQPSWDLKVEQDNEDPLKLNARDFGKGFYLCDNKDEAEMWALLPNKVPGLSDKENMYGEGYLMTYVLNTEGLVIKEVPSDCPGVYALFLLNNRFSLPSDVQYINSLVTKEDVDMYNNIVSEFDVLVGPRLDSKYMSIVSALMAGKLNLEEFEECCQYGGMGSQIYLATKKAYDAVDCISVVKVNDTVKTKHYEEFMDNSNKLFIDKYGRRI